MAGQATLLSIAASSSKAGLHQEVFNILPGTVNPCRGAAQYKSQDQAFSFHKQVRFEDNNSSPELRPDVKSEGGRSSLVHCLLLCLDFQIFLAYSTCTKVFFYFTSCHSK